VASELSSLTTVRNGKRKPPQASLHFTQADVSPPHHSFGWWNESNKLHPAINIDDALNAAIK
jgi:hypothetical protein